jgi:hypothetical protein
MKSECRCRGFLAVNWINIGLRRALPEKAAEGEVVALCKKE